MFQRMFVFLLFLALLGCQPLQGEEVVVERPLTTPSPSATATAVPPTRTPSPTTSPTTFPTITPTVTPSPTPTIVPTPTIRPATLPTEEAYPRPAQGYPVPELTILDSYTSPDSLWQAVYSRSGAIETEVDGYIFFVRLVIERVDGSVSWTAVEEWRYDGLGSSKPAVYQWGANETVYLTDIVHPDGCGRYYDGDGLWELTLTTGEVQPILPQRTHLFALAPDEQAVAYTTSDYIVIRSITETPTEQHIAHELESSYLGPMHWSPNQKQLVLVEELNRCTFIEEERGMALYHIDLNTDSIKMIWQTYTLNAQTPIEWVDDGTLRFVLTEEDTANWLYELETGIITEE